MLQSEVKASIQLIQALLKNSSLWSLCVKQPRIPQTSVDLILRNVRQDCLQPIHKEIKLAKINWVKVTQALQLQSTATIHSKRSKNQVVCWYFDFLNFYCLFFFFYKEARKYTNILILVSLILRFISVYHVILLIYLLIGIYYLEKKNHQRNMEI